MLAFVMYAAPPAPPPPMPVNPPPPPPAIMKISAPVIETGTVSVPLDRMHVYIAPLSARVATAPPLEVIADANTKDVDPDASTKNPWFVTPR